MASSFRDDDGDGDGLYFDVTVSTSLQYYVVKIHVTSSTWTMTMMSTRLNK